MPPTPRQPRTQANLLAELDLLQLAQALQQQAQRHGGYEGEVFDLMLSIADRLEQHHGWDAEQSDAWLERMGVWEGPAGLVRTPQTLQRLARAGA
ncbi:hypothetical protein [Vulcanococcus limneticus]|uniref:hypothetical protein n=1 Tax=Vulcanococcus limneticus TaxID=2170428 RepID=UPI00398BED8E